ncbi:hypothetical protein FO519_009136 [Halicephalobus sp. NKZ332]|nr:hypothetical protein FO519_009136 [Halicephalobus sp. NKZ332]
MDDLIFLPEGKKYYNEFTSIYRNHPDAAFLHYASYVAHLRASKSSERFSLERTLRSIKIGKSKKIGKTVLDPKRIKSVWVHHPHFFPAQLRPYEVPSNDGLILHTRTWEIHSEELYKAAYFKLSGVNKYFANISGILSEKEIRNISLSWETTYKSFKEKGFLDGLRSTNHYHRSIDTCIKSIGGPGSRIIGCRTVYSCILKPIEGFECLQSRQKWRKADGELEAYLPVGEPELEMKVNGCTID